jgi:hypothetical protein
MTTEGCSRRVVQWKTNNIAQGKSWDKSITNVERRQWVFKYLCFFFRLERTFGSKVVCNIDVILMIPVNSYRKVARVLIVMKSQLPLPLCKLVESWLLGVRGSLFASWYWTYPLLFSHRIRIWPTALRLAHQLRHHECLLVLRRGLIPLRVYIPALCPLVRPLPAEAKRGSSCVII